MVQRRLDSIDSTAETNGKEVASLKSLLTNGICKRIDNIDTRVWGILIAVIALLAAVITNMVVG